MADGLRIASRNAITHLRGIERFIPLRASVYAALDAYSAVHTPKEDVMNKRQQPEVSHVESFDFVIDEHSALQRENAALLEDNEDLRASALWWKALYEESQRRCADLETSTRARVTSRVEVRFPVPSSGPAHARRPGAATPRL